MNIPLKNIIIASEYLQKFVPETPLQYAHQLSEKYGAKIFLKREDQTVVRSFKIRGAYYKMSRLTPEQKKAGVVCASAGNHAQGVAYACAKLKVNGVIFMPTPTPNQKVEKVKGFGKNYVEVRLFGNTFDDAKMEAITYCKKHKATFVHPFDDEDVMTGQGTVAHEITRQYQSSINSSTSHPDMVICCVGGGGLLSGVSSYFAQVSPHTQVIGSEPQDADCMNQGIRAGKPVTLEKFDTFVDGAAVRTVGDKTLKIAITRHTKIVVCPVGLVCTNMIELYQNEGIITEPAGALAVSALEELKSQIKGKSVVCVISGGNNDILRYPEIQEKSLVHRGLKHYFILEFAQKPGQLRDFLNHALGPHDDIVLFEYLKRTNKEKGSALVGIELKSADDLVTLLKKMEKIGLNYRRITNDDLVFNLLV